MKYIDYCRQPNRVQFNLVGIRRCRSRSQSHSQNWKSFEAFMRVIFYICIYFFYHHDREWVRCYFELKTREESDVESMSDRNQKVKLSYVYIRKAKLMFFLCFRFSSWSRMQLDVFCQMDWFRNLCIVCGEKNRLLNPLTLWLLWQRYSGQPQHAWSRHQKSINLTRISRNAIRLSS